MALSPLKKDNISSEDKPSCKNLQLLLANEMQEVNKLILKRLQSKVSLIPQLAAHLIQSGGKRLRPLLTLASAHLSGYQGKNHIPLAAAVEFIHTATLLHDDVVDQSDQRRGKETANAIWGNKASVLVGDFLFSRSFELMVEVGSIEILSILSKASNLIAEGEVAQLLTTHNLETTIEDYLTVIQSKTAQLFAAAMRIGPILRGLSEEHKKALEEFGLYIGIAFQLVDDILDYKTEDSALGKKPGNDFRECKITLPIILAYQNGNKTEKAFWERTLQDGKQETSDIDHALILLKEHDVFQKSLQQAKNYQEKAIRKLSLFNDSPIKEALLELTEFVVDRSFKSFGLPFFGK